jgi:hypothetical protein
MGGLQSTSELSIKTLKEGQNHGFDPSLIQLSIKSFVSLSCIGIYFERRVKLLGLPMSTSRALREI